VSNAKTGVTIVLDAENQASPTLNKVAQDTNKLTQEQGKAGESAKKTATKTKKLKTEQEKLAKETKDSGRAMGTFASSVSNIPLAGLVGQAGAAVNAIEDLKEAGLSARMALVGGFAGIAAAAIAAGVALGNAMADAVDKIKGVASALELANKEMNDLNAATLKYLGWQIEDQTEAINEIESIEEREKATTEFIENQKRENQELAAQYRKLSEERKMMMDSFWVTDREHRMEANQMEMDFLNQQMEQRENAQRQATKDLEREKKARAKQAEDEKKRAQEVAKAKAEAEEKTRLKNIEKEARDKIKDAERLQKEAEREKEKAEKTKIKFTDRGGKDVTESRFLQTGRSVINDPVIQMGEKAEATRKAQLAEAKAQTASLRAIEAEQRAEREGIVIEGR
jgi:hypothetical protein